MYAAGRDGSVYALNAVDGSQKWATNTPTSYMISSIPSIAEGVLYVGDGRVYALVADTGVIRWQVSIDGGTGFGLIVAEGTMCIVTSAGKVIMFGVGSPVHAIPAASPIASTAVRTVFPDHTS